MSSPVDATHRLTPDIAADADPATGVDCYTGSTDDKGNVTASWGPGGGTSQAAPIWAGLTALMNEYLHDPRWARGQ